MKAQLKSYGMFFVLYKLRSFWKMVWSALRKFLENKKLDQSASRVIAAENWLSPSWVEQPRTTDVSDCHDEKFKESEGCLQAEWIILTAGMCLNVTDEQKEVS